MTQSVQTTPIPPDIRRELPNQLTPWAISKRIFEEMKTTSSPTLKYKKCQVLPTDPEWRFVWRLFFHNKPNRYSIKRIYCIHERHQTTSFEHELSNLERDADKFKPNWKQEPRADQRAKAIERFRIYTQIFSPFSTIESDGRRRNWNKAKVMPLWHGTNETVCQSISESGFVYFGKHAIAKAAGDPKSTDEGFFGSGIYFTNSAKYAADIYSDGHLLLAWVSMREPFPVVGDPDNQDMKVLAGKGAYKNYSAHYVPVISTDPTDPDNPIYHPCTKNQKPTCDEIVVFHRSQALNRFWVELEVDLPNLMQLLAAPDEPQFVEELIPHIKKVLQNSHVDRDKKLRNMLYKELAALLTMEEDDDLEPHHLELFKSLNQLIDQDGKINKAIRAEVVGVKPSLNPTPQQKQPIQASSYSSIPTTTKKEAIAKPEKPLVAKLSAPAVPAMAFGKAKWAKHFGDIGVEPPLPNNINQILNSPCPIWPDKKVHETHMLTLIPSHINGKQLTLESLGELVKSPRGGGHATKYNSWNPWGNEKAHAEKNYWVLMTRDIIPDSRSKSYSDQCQLVQEIAQKSSQPYDVPHLIEAAVSIFMEHVSTGERLYGLEPRLTFTRCQEKAQVGNRYRMTIGDFGACGLCCGGCVSGGFCGVGVLRKF